MLHGLRAKGYFIGAVIDEAHINFGTNAKQAAAFYLNVLQPDFTVLATATPKDTELDAFCKAAKMGDPNRREIDRAFLAGNCEGAEDTAEAIIELLEPRMDDQGWFDD